MVEKPFGHDLASARDLNRILLSTFVERTSSASTTTSGSAPFTTCCSFASRILIVEAFWNRQHVESVQINMAEDFGIQGRGAFYDATGAIRDVVQNHLFQVLSNVAMEPPARLDSESLRDEKVKVLKSTRALGAEDVVLGQFRGYRDRARRCRRFAGRDVRRCSAVTSIRGGGRAFRFTSAPESAFR